MSSYGSIAGSRVLLGLARRFVTVGDICIRLRNEAPKTGYLLQVSQQPSNNAYFHTPIPAPAASSDARLLYSPHNDSTPEKRPSEAREASGPRPTSRKGLTIDEKSGTTWFSRFLSWAEGKNNQYVQSTEETAKEMEEMDNREQREHLLRRVQEAKRKLKKELKGGK